MLRLALVAAAVLATAAVAADKVIPFKPKDVAKKTTKPATTAYVPPATTAAYVVPETTAAYVAPKTTAAYVAPETTVAYVAPETAKPAPKCTPEYHRCAGATGYAYLEYVECCGGWSCVEAAWLGWGKHCLPAAPACYGDGERCAGSPGKEFVPYAPCCDSRAACVEGGGDWGSYCAVPKVEYTAAPEAKVGNTEKAAYTTKAPRYTGEDTTTVATYTGEKTTTVATYTGK